MILNMKNVLSLHLLTRCILPPQLPPRAVKGTRSKRTLQKHDGKAKKRLTVGGVEDAQFK